MNLKKINFTDKLMKAGGLAAGAIGADIITEKLVPKVMPSADTRIANGIAMAIGLFGPSFLGKKRAARGADMIQCVADGIVAVSAKNLAAGFIPGLEGIGTSYGVDVSRYALDNERIILGVEDEYGASVAGGSGGFDDFVASNGAAYETYP